MRGQAMAVLIGAAVLAVGMVWRISQAPVEIPEPHVPAHREVFPDLDYRAAAPGTSVARLYGSFGKAAPDAQATAPDKRCLLLKYDRELFDGALVVLASKGLVEDRWLVTGQTIPAGCAGLQVEAVDLMGWYAAAVRQ